MGINNSINRLSSFKLWLLFFTYTCCISALVQTVILPYIFSDLHAGTGLFNSSYDSITFHNMAVKLANEIRAKGWSAWQLKPLGQFQVGISSIMYFLILPDPRILIPISSALHASAAIILFNLLNLFLKDKVKAILCILPFLIFPSNLQWTAQWHRDGFSILGLSLVLYGIVSVFVSDLLVNSKLYLKIAHFAFYNISGFYLIWLARPYLLVTIKPVIVLYLILFTVWLIFKAIKSAIVWQKTLIIIPVLLVSLIALFSKTVLYQPDYGEETNKNILIKNQQTTKLNRRDDAVGNKKVEDKKIKSDMIEYSWKRLPLYLQSIDRQAFSLAISRRGFRFCAPGAGSNIDESIGFASVKDIIFYLPRAFQIALFAPFPSQWFSKGTYKASFFMRRISGFEMTIVYFALFFLPYTLWCWRRRIEIWIIFIFCIYMSLIHALIICNVGTLYRMRYLYTTILAAFGIAGFIAFIDNFKKSRTKINKCQLKAIFVSNTTLTIRNFRVGLMQALKSRGYDVVFCAEDNGYADEVIKKGFRYIPVNIDRKGMNFFTDTKQIMAFYRIYKKERPDIVLHYTVKPNIYGSVAALLAGIPCVNNITGLGYVFIKKTPVYFLVNFLYKISSSIAKKTFFQNKDDMNLFFKNGIIDKKKAVLVNGSGVNTTFFSPDYCRSIKKQDSLFTFLLTGRFLWDKGIGEFVDAARLVKRRYPNVQFWLLGIIDTGNPAGVDLKTIKAWETEGVIRYCGEVRDVRQFICQADCVILPSYREGIPRSLLEGLAMEKPIITTDAVGCREVVDDGINGFSVPVKDSRALFNAFCKMIELKPEERLKMGRAGREKVIREFEEEIIINMYINEIEKITG